MARGRPPVGPALVDRLDLPEEAKRRLRAILETVAGEKTIAEAAAELGIGESHFHEIRQRALSGAGESLLPRPTGRPPKAVPEQAAETEELRARVAELERDLDLAQLRAELLASESSAAAEEEAAERAREKKHRAERRRQRKEVKRRRKQKHRR